MPHAQLNRVVLPMADFTGADLTCSSFDQAILEQASFVNTILVGCSFYKANLTKASLSRAILSGASFKKSILTGAYLVRTNLAPQIQIISTGAGIKKIEHPVDFEESQLHMADFFEARGGSPTHEKLVRKCGAINFTRTPPPSELTEKPTHKDEHAYGRPDDVVFYPDDPEIGLPLESLMEQL